MVNPKFFEVLAGNTGCRFVSNDSGQPAKRVITTPFIGTRSRGGNTERGIGVEYFSSLASNEGVHHIFTAMESKNPKEYLRALEILSRMEKMDPDILAVCAHAGRKQASLDDDSCRLLQKYQPLQMKNVLEKRAVVFQQQLDQDVITTIISGFTECGFQTDDPFAKAHKKDEHSSFGGFPMNGAEMNAMSLAM